MAQTPASVIPDPPRLVDVVVIGGGQAGIAAARELQRRGFVGYASADAGARGAHRLGSRSGQYADPSFVVLDANPTPGGAWSHRWDSLTMATINHIADLPGLHAPEYEPTTRANIYVPAYFAEFEDKYDLPIFRPVRVLRVEEESGRPVARPGARTAGSVADAQLAQNRAAHAAAVATAADGQPPREWNAAPASSVRGRLRVETTAGTWLARYVINATGTWTRPFIPYYPGVELFAGKQYHTANYRDKEDFWRLRVLVVGGGISALEHIAEVATVAKKVRWVTRHEPRFVEDDTRVGRSLTAAEGHAIEERVGARVAAGYLPESVVAATGIPRVGWVRDMEAAGLLKRKPMFTRLDVDGAWWEPARGGAGGGAGGDAGAAGDAGATAGATAASDAVAETANNSSTTPAGKFERFDAIIWATGFRSELRHLAPLKLRTVHGGVAMEGTHVLGDLRIHLVGHGPSQSTIGARHWSRVAVRAIVEDLERRG